MRFTVGRRRRSARRHSRPLALISDEHFVHRIYISKKTKDVRKATVAQLL